MSIKAEYFKNRTAYGINTTQEYHVNKK